MPIQIRQTNLPALTGGMNDAANLLSLSKNEAHLIQNCHLDSLGVARTRKGLRKVNASAMDGKITSIFQYRKMVGGTSTFELLVSTISTWYSVDISTGTCTAIVALNAVAKPDVVSFPDGSTGNAVAILANGTDFIAYNGTTVTNLMTTFHATVSAPRYLQVYANRLHVCGCATDPYVVWSSALYNPTSWGANDYFSLGKGDGDAYLGMGLYLDYMVLFKKFRTEYVTEGNPQSATVKHNVASYQYGHTSRWAYQPVGAYGYFMDESNEYRLQRNDTTGDLEVVPIGMKVAHMHKNIISFNEIHSVYDAKNKEILWGLTLTGDSEPTTSLVYSTELSRFNPYKSDWNVWTGVHCGTGYEPLVFGVVTGLDDIVYVYSGDSHGYIFCHDESDVYKDNSIAIETLIHTCAIAPAGIGIRKNFRSIVPSFWQRVDNSTQIGWVLDSAYHRDETDISYEDVAFGGVAFNGNVAYWNAVMTAYMTQKWGSTIWAAEAIVPETISINTIGRYIEFLLYNDGSEATDEIEYSGIELRYQIIGIG